MIQDLFSHKIHSSGADWPDKLVELAGVFAGFDGTAYDRDAIEAQLIAISPRSAYAHRDVSKFRDEISAYPAYLGLYYVKVENHVWTVHLSEATKRFLLREEPDVGAFLRVQLPLFQYPNGHGAVYHHTGTAHIQSNARDRTLQFVQAGIHLAPLRLIVRALQADAELGQVDILRGTVTYSEVFAVANDARVNRHALPSVQSVRTSLADARAGRLGPPADFERRFHLLRHTDVFELTPGGIRIRQPVDAEDEREVRSTLESWSNERSEFHGFDQAVTGDDIARVIESGAWGEYFDGVRTLSTSDTPVLSWEADLVKREAIPAAPQLQPERYPLENRPEVPPIPAAPSNRRTELADPEATRIKRQRRNLAHKQLTDKMDQLLRDLGAVPQINAHVDLFAAIPGDGRFLFEVKSGGENYLDQIRKAVSQLYEYRFRYRAVVGENVSLCLVLPERPRQAEWIIEYLCVDRGIALCWFSEQGALDCPAECQGTVAPLRPNA